MKLVMTGLDHNHADLGVREKFAITKEKSRLVLAAIKGSGMVGGCVMISTCNRTELYASVPPDSWFEPSKALCGAIDRDFDTFKQFFVNRTDNKAIEHLCRVASGLDSQILGDDQIITQVRESLELSRDENCTDSYIETMFRLSVQAAKAIKTNVILKSQEAASVPGKAVDKLKSICALSGKNAVVIGNGQMGRLATELLIGENVNVTVTLREYKKGVVQVPAGAATISYSERYKAIEGADIVVSATTSPHFTIWHDDLRALSRLPETIVDLAVPRDVEPSIGDLAGITLLTIDDISGSNRSLPPESISKIEEIIAAHIDKYYKWCLWKHENLLAKGILDNGKVKSAV